MKPQAEIRSTTLTLTAGTLLSAACLVIGFVLGLATAERPARDPRQLGLVLESVLALEPWGWSMLGVLVLMATPVAALVATFFEMRRVEPRTSALALIVLGILSLAALIAVAAI